MSSILLPSISVVLNLITVPIFIAAELIVQKVLFVVYLFLWPAVVHAEHDSVASALDILDIFGHGALVAVIVAGRSLAVGVLIISTRYPTARPQPTWVPRFRARRIGITGCNAIIR